MNAIAAEGIRFLEILLRHPLLLAAPTVVAAILCGAGRGLGLPLLFWHERRGPQALAGLAATLLVAETCFVAYLLAGPGHIDAGLVTFMVSAGAAWAVVLGVAVVLRLVRRIASREGDTGGMTPGVRSVRDGRPAAARGAPPVWPLLGARRWALSRQPASHGWASGRDGRLLACRVAAAAVSQDGDDACAHGFAAVVFFAVLAAYVLARSIATPAVGLPSCCR
jgi:hypothetical protein